MKKGRVKLGKEEEEEEEEGQIKGTGERRDKKPREEGSGENKKLKGKVT